MLCNSLVAGSWPVRCCRRFAIRSRVTRSLLQPDSACGFEESLNWGLLSMRCHPVEHKQAPSSLGKQHKLISTRSLTWTMNALEDTNEEDVCVFLTLDDACLAAILGNLSAQQLRAAAAVCKRLLAISSADSLWIKHIKDNFGLCISTVKGAQRVPGAALQLYNRCAAAAAAACGPGSTGADSNRVYVQQLTMHCKKTNF